MELTELGTERSPQWDDAWWERVKAVEATKGRVICGAKAKSTGAPCESHPKPERARCGKHGGKSPRGVESPQWKGGISGKTKDLPARLLVRVQEALEHPDATSLLTDIAVLDARLGELYGRLTSNEAELAWNRLGNLEHAIELARAGVEGYERLLDIDEVHKELKTIIADARNERSNWTDILEVKEAKRKLADTERRRDEMLQATMTARQVATFMGTLQLAILELITDPLPSADELRAKLGMRIRVALLQNSGGGRALEGD